MITFIVTAIGVVSGVIALVEFGINARKRKALSWADTQPLIDDVVKRIEQDREELPDVVLGIGRGGILVAALMAQRLSEDIEIVLADTDSTSRSHGRVRVSMRYPDQVPDLTGKRVLIVVGELYKGLDLDAALDFVEDRGASEIRTLGLLVGPTTIVQPDSCGLATKHAPLAPWRLNAHGRGDRL